MEYYKVEDATKEYGQRLTVVAHRLCTSTGQVGPRVIFNEKTGVSLMVTRYSCTLDWEVYVHKAANACLHPYHPIPGL